jgi:hypothetical protein
LIHPHKINPDLI